MRKDLKVLSEIYSRVITEKKGRKVITGNVNLSKLHLKEMPAWLAGVEIDGSFDCSNNYLTSLAGSPKRVTGKFNCSFNRLTSLVGGPVEVLYDYDCFRNRLVNLQGAPKKFHHDGDFRCHGNRLTSLVGAPRVATNFSCDDNYLKSLEGAPEFVAGDFECFDNTVSFTEEDVYDVCEVDGAVVTDENVEDYYEGPNDADDDDGIPGWP
jgi:hypothetical protein